MLDRRGGVCVRRQRRMNVYGSVDGISLTSFSRVICSGLRPAGGAQIGVQLLDRPGADDRRRDAGPL